MQVSATLIAAQQAAQQAAREARARLQMPQAPAQGGFAAALEKTAGGSQTFETLPLRQTAPSQATQSAAPPQQGGVRLGQYVNIVV